MQCIINVKLYHEMLENNNNGNSHKSVIEFKRQLN